MPIKEAQKTYSQHAVPQNIMDVEFKLIGDLTMRQFTYLMVFGFLAYIVYLSAAGVFKLPLTLVFVLLGLALAFVPIQERGMDEWFVNFFKSVYSPSQMVWKKETVLPPAFTYQNLAVVKQELITLAPTSSRRKLEEYLEVQQRTDSQDKLDIPEREYILKVRQAFAPVTSSVSIFDDSSPSLPDFDGAKLEKEDPVSYRPFKPLAEEAKAPKQEHAESVKPDQQEVPTKDTSSEGSKEKVKESERHLHLPSLRKPHTVDSPKPQPVKTSAPDDFTYTPMTPDRHSGRKFTRVLPAEGQLILPVRGEKVLQTSEDLNIQKDIEEKTSQLKQLLDQIKAEKPIDKPQIQSEQLKTEDKGPDLSEAQDVVKKVKEENERLSNEIQKLRTDIQQSQESDEEKRKKQEILDRLEREKNQTNTDYTALQKQVLELQRRLKEQADTTTNVDTSTKQPTYAKMQPITNDSNIVSGIVKNNSGDVLTGAVLLIKNHKGESVRALKTNALGQFSISTPLVNGLYTLEIGSSIEGQTFDIITIEVKGEIIPPIEIVGRPV